MTYNSEALKQGNQILQKINDEQIDSNSLLIKKVRTAIKPYYINRIHENLLNQVTITYTGIGLCGELAHRFQLEYFITTGKRDCKILVLRGPIIQFNHALLIIGKINESNRTLTGFIETNPDLIYVDPLINFIGVRGNLQPLLNYSNVYSLDTVANILDGVNMDMDTALSINNEAQIKGSLLKKEFPRVKELLLQNKSIFFRPNHHDSIDHFLIRLNRLEKKSTELTLKEQEEKFIALYNLGRAYLQTKVVADFPKIQNYLKQAEMLAQKLKIENINPSIEELLELCSPLEHTVSNNK